MRSLLIIILIIIFILCSCSEKLNYDKVRIDLSKYESIINLHEYSDSLRVIKLETSEECLINRFDRIIEDDSLLFILDKGNKSIYIFKSNGQYYRTINHFGRGPGEYIRICDIEIDREKDLIFLYDDNIRNMTTYSYEGGYISNKYLPEFLMRSFAKRKNGNFLVFTPDNNHPLRDGVWEIDSEGILIREYADVNKKHKLAYGAYPYFARVKEKYSYLNYFDNYIYTLGKAKLEKKLLVKIKQKIPDKYLSIPEGVDEKTFTGSYYMPETLNETYEYYHFSNYSSVSVPARIHVFIEKNSHRLIIADSLICDFENFRNIQRVFSNEGKNFFGVLESNADDNPALVAFNLKPIQH